MTRHRDLVRHAARIVITLLIGLVVASQASAPPSAAHAQQGGATVGFFPSRVHIADGLRGQRYEQGTVLLNRSDDARTFRFEAEGEIKEWVQFALRSRPEALLTEALAEPQGELMVVVYFAIPAGTPNGSYSGLVRYRSMPQDPRRESADQSGSGVLLSLDQPVTIVVTGNQVLSLNVSDVSARDIEVGQPLRFRAGLTNKSNVDVTPVLQVTLKTSAGVPIADLQQQMESFKPNESKALAALEWDTSGQQPGGYVASYVVSAQGRAFADGVIQVRLLPFGTLTRSGEIKQITFHGRLTPGSVARADVMFHNTGASDVRARFLGELYRDDRLLGEAVSQADLLVPVSETATLTVFFDLDRRGVYELRGRVNFEGALSESVVARLDLSGSLLDRVRDAALGWPGPTAVGLVASAVAAIAWRFRRTRGRRRAVPAFEVIYDDPGTSAPAGHIGSMPNTENGTTRVVAAPGRGGGSSESR